MLRYQRHQGADAVRVHPSDAVSWRNTHKAQSNCPNNQVTKDKHNTSYFLENVLNLPRYAVRSVTGARQHANRESTVKLSIRI